MRTLVRLVAAALLLAAGPAAAADAALHKDGYWTVGRDDADSKSCIASISVEGGKTLMVQVATGHWDVVVAVDKPIRAGRRGVLTVDAQRFEFTPDYTDNREILFLEDPGGRAFDALRTARNVVVEVDGREVLSADIADSGASDAFDGAVACSKGESGWWGPGVAAPPSKAAMNKEKVWFLERSEIGPEEVCTAYTFAGEHAVLVFIGAAEFIGVGVKTDSDMRKSGKGLVEADRRRIAIKPVFDGRRYFASDQPIEGEDLEAVRTAQNLRISVGDQVVIDAKVAGTGLPALLDDLAACSKGVSGWWGEGAKQP